ncbi:MAG TPA: sulfatase-like hydrolase/transferase [Rickettsiales bacterium]|nr:sulfatase-like hydrolase/transferase [Rickettsiales bacterium]
MFFDILSFLSLTFLLFFIGTDRKYRNFSIALAVASMIVLEILSISFIKRSIDEYFIFFLMNIDIFHLTITTKIIVLYYFTLFFIVLCVIFYVILKKVQIKRYKRIVINICLIILILPNGFFYDIFHMLFVDYGVSYLKYKDKTYQEIFKLAKNEEYTIKDNLKILNKKEKHKNLVLIYLESFDQSYLTDDNVKDYTKNIQKLASENQFYNDIEQVKGCWGTVPGIICTQCGVQNISYFLIDNTYGKIRDTQLVCLPDILNKANYTQVFLGGADKKLFNKGNYLLSHQYDIVEDRDSLIQKDLSLEEKLSDWGVADYDIFDIAKKEYVNLSKQNKPFNLTILTTATHSPNGLRDKRCKNSSENKILNAAECTDTLVGDFVNFLKKQKNYKDTTIIIMPDHRQFAMSSLNKLVDQEKEKLYFIVLNGDRKKDTVKDYTNLPNFILKTLNVKSNANFLSNEEDDELVKNFIYKIHNK